VTQQVMYRVVVHGIRSQMAVLRVALQQSLTLQEAANAFGHPVGQLGEFIAGWRLDSVEPGRCVCVAVEVDAVLKQHVEMKRLRPLPLTKG